MSRTIRPARPKLRHGLSQGVQRAARHIAGVVCALCLTLLAVGARAQDADAHFNEGMKQMAQKNYDAACAAFEKSEVPHPTMASRYQLGTCNERRGRYASAHRAYLDAADIADRKGDSERAKVARKRASELEERIPLLLIATGAAEVVEGLTISDNGEPVPREDWNKPRMVDAGNHAITFSAPGYQPMTVNVQAETPKQVARIELPALAKGAGGAATPAPVGEPDSASGGGYPALFWVGVGLTAGGGLFTLLGAIDFALCEACADDDLILPVGGLVLGGALLAVGIPFMVVGSRSGDDEAEPPAASVEALLSPTSAGLRVRF